MNLQRIVLLICCSAVCSMPVCAQDAPPQFEVDPFWPAALPNNWIIGQVSGIAVDANDHVWIVHRPRSITPQEAAAVQNPPTGDCCVPAPSVIEFDTNGQVLQAWGGPRWDQASSAWIEPDYDWPLNEHGIHVDAENNVWLAGNGADDHIVLKFSSDGAHLMTIGIVGETGGSNDTTRLGRPAEIDVDLEANEVYVADGYGNRRVIVFDSNTGKYKRHWGAYGRVPSDDPLPDYASDAAPTNDFRGPVHSVKLADDGRVYVADRISNRVQVFLHDGTFVEEAVVAAWTLDQGGVWDIELSNDSGQTWLYVADGHNKKLWILRRDSLEVVGSIGHGGRNAGQFEWVHNLAGDSSGNLYTAEVNTGKRVQKFRRLN